MATDRFVAAANAENAAGPGIADVCQKPYDGKIRDNVAQYSEDFSKAEETRTEKTIQLTQSYYTLVTDFYEYGYGASFHFGPVRDGQALQDCLLEYEHEIARNLNARPGMRILVSVFVKTLF